jgi:hypothetical protein
MNMEQIVDLNTFADGAVAERFNLELQKVLENFADLNTDPTAKRKINLVVTLSGDDARDVIITHVQAKTSFTFERWYEAEEFNIKLQSVFVQNEDRDIMLKVVGNIKEEDVRTVGDNGVSQSVTAKVGVATVGQVEVPNPVALMPFRTFVEVEQPESNFIFRMQNGPRCALFEADGGAWKVQAMKNIKDYLLAALEEEFESKKLVIIA